MRNVDMWIHGRLTSAAESYNDPEIADAVLATATLIDFPGFRDVHGSIFGVFRPRTNQPYFPRQQWETYVKYRQFLSEFLTDRSRSGALFVGPAHYINLAERFWSILRANSDTLTTNM
jgi:hypothetical protein